jgi:hypothetical protein
LGCRNSTLLGCAPSVLANLRLCRRPRAGEDEAVVAIAERFGADASALRRVVEEVEDDG